MMKKQHKFSIKNEIMDSLVNGRGIAHNKHFPIDILVFFSPFLLRRFTDAEKNRMF